MESFRDWRYSNEDDGHVVSLSRIPTLYIRLCPPADAEWMPTCIRCNRGFIRFEATHLLVPHSLRLPVAGRCWSCR